MGQGLGSKARIRGYLMKRVAVLVGCMLFAGVTLAAPASMTFTGSIMDSMCARMGTHAKMEQAHSGLTDKQCTQACVKAGGKFVLFDPATKTVYQLDDQKAPMDYAGDNVKVTGTLDKATNTIHVEKIDKGA
jgi:Protein of unknown function (DUF5818)